MDLTFLHVEAAAPLSATAVRRHRTDNVRGRPAPLPTLIFDAPDQWTWPAPPLAWRHEPMPANRVAQPCTVESVCGTTLRGEMRHFDPTGAVLGFASTVDAETVPLGFSNVRRLTLTTPVRMMSQTSGVRVTRGAVAAQVRHYTLHGSAQTPSMTGRTAGHVETTAGLYLFPPIDEEAALQRVFVPRGAYTHCAFGSSAEEIAARLWITSPQALLAAIERQLRMPVLPLGQSLLALGLLTPAQLSRELARQDGNLPLGEALVAGGLISDTDLQTAISHKMGYPMVDLTKFPVDLSAVAQLPRDIAAHHHLLPLMMDRARLIVAVDKPSRVTELRSLHLPVQKNIVPVLASAIQIAVALDKLSPDVWSAHVIGRPSTL